MTQKSGFTAKQLGLLKIFAKEPWKSFTVSEIRDALKSRSHHYAYSAIGALNAKGIIRESVTGKTLAYSVDYENSDNAGYLAVAEQFIKEERKDLPLKILKQVTDAIRSPYHTFIIGGSYASGKQKPASDIDIAVIIPDSGEKKSFEVALRRGELIIPEVHGFVFTQEELYLMLANKEYNFGKELARKHVIVFGAEPYYRILFEAMKNGFKC